MALTVSTSSQISIAFETDDFYFEVDQIFVSNKWIELADACKNNSKASIKWETENTIIDISVNNSMVRFSIQKYNQKKDDYGAKIIYKLPANKCEEAFREAPKF